MPRQLVAVTNTTTETIPAFAAMRIVDIREVDTGEGYTVELVGVAKPDEDGQQNVLLNGRAAILASGRGVGIVPTGPQTLAYGGADVPAIGETWGVASGSWLVAKDKPGWQVIADGVDGWCAAVPVVDIPPRLVVQRRDGTQSCPDTATLSLGPTDAWDLFTLDGECFADLNLTGGVVGSTPSVSGWYNLEVSPSDAWAVTYGATGATMRVISLAATSSSNGHVTTGAQGFSGLKTFENSVIIAATSPSPSTNYFTVRNQFGPNNYGLVVSPSGGVTMEGESQTVPVLNLYGRYNTYPLPASLSQVAQAMYVDGSVQIRDGSKLTGNNVTLTHYPAGELQVGYTSAPTVRIGSGGKFAVGTADGVTGTSGPLVVTGGLITSLSGGGGSAGTVTSVGLALPSIFTVSGSPVTTSGTLTGTLATQTANRIFAGPTSGGAAAPTFRKLVTADLDDGIVTLAKLADLPGNSVIGRAPDTSGVPAAITAAGGNTGVLGYRSDTDVLAWFQPLNGYLRTDASGVITTALANSVVGRAGNTAGVTSDIQATIDNDALVYTGTAVGWGAVPPAGAVLGFARTVPTGFLGCDGSAVSRTTYSRLFSVVGTTFGAGDGSTTFNLPDLRGRTVIGSGTGSGLTARTLGATGGVETHPLTTAELATHTHTTGGYNPLTFRGDASGTLQLGGSGTQTAANAVANAGSGTAHQNMQPFLVLTYGIKF